jgi:ATP synthase protein I
MPEDKPSRSSPRQSPRFNYRRLAELSSLGLMLPSSIAVGLAIGYILDKLLGTHPWLLGIFTLLGIASGFLSLIRGLKKLGIEKDRENEDND